MTRARAISERAIPRASNAWGSWLALGLAACAGAGDSSEADAGVDPELDAAVEADGSADAEAPSEPEPVALVHSALWSEVAREDDPFARPEPVRCLPDSFGAEPLGGELVFYVRTEFCPALTVQQASRADLAAGQTLRARLFHFSLTAPENASAQLIVRLGDDEVLREELPIPSPQAQLELEWVSPRDYARGTPVWFHVENHGANEYVLIALERL